MNDPWYEVRQILPLFEREVIQLPKPLVTCPMCLGTGKVEQPPDLEPGALIKAIGGWLPEKKEETADLWEEPFMVTYL